MAKREASDGGLPLNVKHGLCGDCYGKTFTLIMVGECQICRRDKINSLFTHCKNCALNLNQCSYCKKPLWKEGKYPKVYKGLVTPVVICWECESRKNTNYAKKCGNCNKHGTIVCKKCVSKKFICPKCGAYY